MRIHKQVLHNVKKYCSAKCKKNAAKTQNSKLKVSHKCFECDEIYFRPPSQSSYSKFCSRLCQNRHQAKARRLDTFLLTCTYCKSDFISQNAKAQFCKNECCKLFKRKEKWITKSCKQCCGEFASLIIRNKIYCSKVCQSAAQSSGKIPAYTKGRGGRRKDLNDEYFRSSLEADFARYCKFKNITSIYEYKTFAIETPKGIRHYTPDFYLPEADKYVELKAGRKDHAFEKNLVLLEILKQGGLNIDVIFMSAFYNSLKEEKVYDSIPNLEHRNYRKTKYLIGDV